MSWLNFLPTIFQKKKKLNFLKKKFYTFYNLSHRVSKSTCKRVSNSSTFELNRQGDWVNCICCTINVQQRSYHANIEEMHRGVLKMHDYWLLWDLRCEFILSSYIDTFTEWLGNM